MSHKVTTIIKSDKAVANNESRLSICLLANGFSFSIIASHDEIVLFAEVEFDFNIPLGILSQSIKDFFAQNNISTFGFKQATLAVYSDDFVWVPEHLHEPVRNRQYLQMVSKPALDSGIYHIAVPHLHSMMVFTAPATVVTAFKLAIPGIDVHCQHSILASQSLLKKSALHPVLLMHVRDRVGDFEAFYNNQLLLSNSFSASNENELLYRAIELMKQLHLETPDMELAICGNVGREIYSLLQHYFPNVSLYTGHPFTFTNPQFHTLPTYKHIMLFS